MPAPVACL